MAAAIAASRYFEPGLIRSTGVPDAVLRKVRAGRIGIGFNMVYFTDLNAAQLDFRVVFHD